MTTADEAPLAATELPGGHDPAAPPADAASALAALRAPAARRLPVFDALALLGLIDGWREPPPGSGARPVSLAARVVEAFRRDVDGVDPVLAARLPLAALLAEARRRMREAIGIAWPQWRLDALELLRHAPTPAAAQGPALRWYGILGEEAACGELLARRRQAARIAPFLAGVLPVLPELRAAVDEGRPLWDAAARALDLPRALAAAMGGLRLPVLAGDDGAETAFADALRLLRTLPVERLREAREGDAAAGLALCLRLERAAQRSGLPAGSMFGLARQGGLAGLSRRLGKALADRRPPEGLDEAGFAFLRRAMPLAEVAAAPAVARRGLALFHAARLAPQLPGVAPAEVADWAVRVAPPCEDAVLLEGVRDIAVMARAHAHAVLLPLWWRDRGGGPCDIEAVARAERAAARLLCEGRSGQRLLAMARVFRIHERDLLVRPASEPEAPPVRDKDPLPVADPEWRRWGLTPPVGERSWPPIARPWMAPGTNLAVVPLSCEEHLRDEGRGWDGPDLCPDGSRGLAICVGISPTYAQLCREGRTQILSIRRLREDGGPIERLACVELRVADWPKPPAVVQCRGRHNRSAPRPAAEVLERWLAALGRDIPVEPAFEHHVGSARRGRDDRGGRRDLVRLLCGYDWRLPAAWRAVQSAWAGVFGSDVPDEDRLRSCVETILERTEDASPSTTSGRWRPG